ncbi:glycosyltransferase family 4 protein [Methanocella conradii]|uniref:glycosyltransferase family 4 protein n=1 Tax=Methanocella conradii TaxID=1175444 RepID=UPI0024B36DB6|nr:glycosyltransferase family 4 protein [Methanocella conradii]MDI6896785.1 glycosyltransferase family 4 protein [Methanocella conradii]
MKICIVVGGYLETGGIQTQSVELSRALAARGHEVRILCMGSRMPIPAGVMVDVIEKPFTMGVFSRIKRLYREGELDIVHAQGCAGFNVMLNRIFQGVPFVLTLHSTAVSEYKVSQRTFWDKKYYATFYLEEALPCHLASVVIAVSEYTAGAASRHYFLGRERITVIPNGIDSSRFKDDGPCRKDGRTVLMVGRIDPRKGYMEFVEHVAPMLVKRVPGIKIDIVGDEFSSYLEYAERLKRSVVDKGLSNNVKFLGAVPFDELRQRYNSSDLFLLASKEEGFGIVLLEAQCCGLPVVAFNNSGIREAVDNGRSGLLVNTYEEMADAVAELMSDDKRRAEMGAAARAFAARFSWDSIAEQVEKVYERVINKGK